MLRESTRLALAVLHGASGRVSRGGRFTPQPTLSASLEPPDTLVSATGSRTSVGLTTPATRTSASYKQLNSGEGKRDATVSTSPSRRSRCNADSHRQSAARSVCLHFFRDHHRIHRVFHRSVREAFTRTDDRHVRGSCCLANGRLFTLVRTNNLATVASRARMDGNYVRDYLNRGSSDECDHQQRWRLRLFLDSLASCEWRPARHTLLPHSAARAQVPNPRHPRVNRDTPVAHWF